MLTQDESTLNTSSNANKESMTVHAEDPRNAKKEDQITNAEEQDEIVNEPNYKTNREEENTTTTITDQNKVVVNENPEITNPDAIKKEQPGAEA